MTHVRDERRSTFEVLRSMFDVRFQHDDSPGTLLAFAMLDRYARAYDLADGMQAKARVLEQASLDAAKMLRPILADQWRI